LLRSLCEFHAHPACPTAVHSDGFPVDQLLLRVHLLK
jgi:hypothetical protein